MQYSALEIIGLCTLPGIPVILTIVIVSFLVKSYHISEDVLEVCIPWAVISTAVNAVMIVLYLIFN